MKTAVSRCQHYPATDGQPAHPVPRTGSGWAVPTTTVHKGGSEWAIS